MGQPHCQKVFSVLQFCPVHPCEGVEFVTLLMLTPLNAFDVDTILNHFPQWGHFPQSLDLFYCPVSGVNHLLLSSETTNSKSEI